MKYFFLFLFLSTTSTVFGQLIDKKFVRVNDSTVHVTYKFYLLGYPKGLTISANVNNDTLIHYTTKKVSDTAAYKYVVKFQPGEAAKTVWIRAGEYYFKGEIKRTGKE